ncbi:hypothetical protein G443_000615 [Actinoalloteichus cyanogriseus DSM 43889]|uniref:Uncharacterized protein n=1 Tax=Actinoalloteichus caeruleus DSM 43889 TaxID=1120930 RepID=A0ABT1JCY3_ACTCY|nr:hypothetical protein [Actinoalloteichus caeruleus DSM 43889]
MRCGAGVGWARPRPCRTGHGPAWCAPRAEPGDAGGGEFAGHQHRRDADPGRGAGPREDDVVESTRQVPRSEGSGLGEGVRRAEGGTVEEPPVCPVRRGVHLPCLQGAPEPGQVAPFDHLDHLLRVGRADAVPVQAAGAQVRAGREEVAELPPGRRERGVGRGRSRQQQRRVAHQPALVDDLVEGARPGLTEGDRVVAEVGPRTGGTGVDDDGGRRGPQRHGTPGRPAEQAVADRQVGGEDHRVARDEFPVGGADPGGPPPRPHQFGDLGPVAERGTALRRHLGVPPRYLPHPPSGEVDAGDGVHVPDDPVHGQGLSRLDTGVERLEGEHPPQAGVAQETAHRAVQPAEGAEPDQPGELGGAQVQR